MVPASAAQRNIRQAVGDRDADLGAGGVKALLGLAHVRALGDELRGKAHGQFLRQLQAGQLELLGWVLAGETAGKSRQQIALLGQLLEQRRQRRGDLRELRLLRRDVEPAGVTLGKLQRAGFAACSS